LEKLYLCMRNKKPEVTLDEEIRKKAYLSLKRMLEMSK